MELDQKSHNLGFKIINHKEIYYQGAPLNLRHGSDVTVIATAADASSSTMTFSVSIDAVPSIGDEPLNVAIPEPLIGKDEPILIGKYYDRDKTYNGFVQYSLDDASLEKGFYVTENGWVYFKGSATAIGNGIGVNLTLNDNHNSPVTTTIRVTKSNWFNSDFPDTLYWHPKDSSKRFGSVAGSDPSITYSLDVASTTNFGTVTYNRAVGRLNETGFRLTSNHVLEYHNNGNDYSSRGPQYLTIIATKGGVTSNMRLRLRTNRKPHFYRLYNDNPVKPLLNTEQLTSSTSIVSLGHLKAADPDGGDVTFSLSGPVGFSIDSSTGEVTYTGDGKDLPATVSLTITASDGVESSSRSFIVNVGSLLKITTNGWSTNSLSDALGQSNVYGYSTLFSFETNKRGNQQVTFNVNGLNLSDTWKNHYELLVIQQTGEVLFRVKPGSNKPDVSALMMVSAERGNGIDSVRNENEVVKVYYQIAIKDGALYLAQIPDVLTNPVLRYRASLGGKQAIGSLLNIEGGAVTLKELPAGYSVSHGILYFDLSVSRAVMPNVNGPTLPLEQGGQTVGHVKVSVAIEVTTVNSAVPEPDDETNVVEIRIVGKGASDRSSSAPRYTIRLNGDSVSSGIVPNAKTSSLSSRQEDDYRSIAVTAPKDINIKDVSIELVNPDSSNSKGLAISNVRINGYRIHVGGGQFTHVQGAEPTTGFRTDDHGVEITGGGVYTLSAIEAKMKYAKEYLLIPGETYIKIYGNLAHLFDKTGPALNDIISQLDPEIAIKYLQGSSEIYRPDLISSKEVTPVTATDVRGIQSGTAKKSFDDLKAMAALELLEDDLSSMAGLPLDAVRDKLIDLYDEMMAGTDVTAKSELQAQHFRLWASENGLTPDSARATTLYSQMMMDLNTLFKNTDLLSKEFTSRTQLSETLGKDLTLGATNGLDTAYGNQFSDFRSDYQSKILPGLAWLAVLQGNISANDLVPAGTRHNGKLWSFNILTADQMSEILKDNTMEFTGDGDWDFRFIKVPHPDSTELGENIKWLYQQISDRWGDTSILTNSAMQQLGSGCYRMINAQGHVFAFQRSSGGDSSVWTAQELTEMFTTLFDLDANLRTSGTAENKRFKRTLQLSSRIDAVNRRVDPTEYQHNAGKRTYLGITTGEAGFPSASGYNFNALLNIDSIARTRYRGGGTFMALGDVLYKSIQDNTSEKQQELYDQTEGQTALSILVPYYSIAIDKGMGRDLNTGDIAFETVMLLLSFIPGVAAAGKGAAVGSKVATTLGKLATRLGARSGSLAGKFLQGLSKAITKTPNVVKAVLRELVDIAFPITDLAGFATKSVKSLRRVGQRLFSKSKSYKPTRVAKRLGPDAVGDYGVFRPGSTPDDLSLTSVGNDKYRWYKTRCM
ncbi:hypothetical protein AB835_12720 [Candidatus Endobugula sertula]|uniref:Cadherin domain-containing protein n=1 Tax=Candidatus Endobugula sertula TaxID=62101 RepID=A0A1D2QMB7_9GAMM|nr:hypothetical protein AB835_12720 [Candidatus Endobugula sertula]